VRSFAGGLRIRISHYWLSCYAPPIANNAYLSSDGEPGAQVLVAVLNHPRDLTIARDQHWYRIPIASADKWVGRRWPPQWLAFYQTKVFGQPEAFAINYYCQVIEIRRATRLELFPGEPRNEKSTKRYYQLMLAPLRKLPQQIQSRRWRRIVFIPTTWRKFIEAEEVNDLSDESPLEDRLWKELKRVKIPAERQDFITANGSEYALDFAFYCVRGKLNVETDGDRWHSDPRRIPEDNKRDNDLETSGWKLLRFNALQLNHKMRDECLHLIKKNIENLGGLQDGRVVPRDVQIDPNSPSQMSLFDD
jgi:very-short-patch-repair endonuclease